MGKNKKLSVQSILIKTVLSLLIAAAFLWYTIEHMLQDAAGSIPNGNVWSAIWESILQLPWWGIVGYIFFFLVVHLARIVRWVYQVQPLGEHDSKKVFRICSVGFGAIIILPLRLGEIVRPIMLARESDISFSQALGTTVVERVIDGLVITGLLFLSIWTAPEQVPLFVRSTGLISLFVFLGASLGLALFAIKRAWMIWLLKQTFGRISTNIFEKLQQLFIGFVDGISSLNSSRTLLPFLALTALYWTANAIGMWFLAMAFGLQLPLFAGFGLLSMLVVGIMIPAGPGFLGNFQLFLSEALKLYLPISVIGATGLAFALSMNAIQFVIQVGFAIPFFLASGLQLQNFIQIPENQSVQT